MVGKLEVKETAAAVNIHQSQKSEYVCNKLHVPTKLQGHYTQNK